MSRKYQTATDKKADLQAWPDLLDAARDCGFVRLGRAAPKSAYVKSGRFLSGIRIELLDNYWAVYTAGALEAMTCTTRLDAPHVSEVFGLRNVGNGIEKKHAELLAVYMLVEVSDAIGKDVAKQARKYRATFTLTPYRGLRESEIAM